MQGKYRLICLSNRVFAFEVDIAFTCESCIGWKKKFICVDFFEKFSLLNFVTNQMSNSMRMDFWMIVLSHGVHKE